MLLDAFVANRKRLIIRGVDCCFTVTLKTQQSKKLTGAIFAYSQGDSSSVESLLAEIDGYLRDRAFSRAIAMILRGNIDDALDQFEQLMDASDYSTMLLIRGSPLWWGLFPEYFEHPRG